jgi:tetratricopeptide (TPR) repeat protein
MECSLAMKFYPGKPAPQPEKRQKHFFTFAIELLLLQGLLLVFPPSLLGKPIAATQQASQPQDELSRRMKAARAARDSRDQAAVESANQRLIAQAFREMARLRLMEGDYQQAIDRYNDSLRYEDIPGTRIDLAIAELQAGQFDNAIKLAKNAHATGPDDIRASTVLRNALMQEGEFAAALDPLTRVAGAEPSVENDYLLGIGLLNTGKPEDKLRAQAVFDRMKKSSGDSGSLHVLFGRAYRDSGDTKRAIHEFQRAIELDPHTPHAHFFLGLAQISLNDWKPTPEAEEEFKKELESYPNDYLANYMLGLFNSVERHYEQSDWYLKAAAKLSPSAPEPFLYLGLNAFSQDNMPLAEEMLRKAVTLTGADEARTQYQIRRAYVDLARILIKEGRKEESDVFAAKARALENKVMVESQQHISTMVLSGGAGSAAAVMPLSIKQENQAAPAITDSDDPSAPGKLTPEQRTAAQARDKELRSVLALAYNDLATSQAIRGGYTLALDSYRQAEQWDPAFPGLEKNLGQSAFKAKDYGEAIHGLSQALPLEPGSHALRAMLGICYFATDQFAEAARTFAPLGTAGMLDSETGYAWAASLTHSGDTKQASQVLAAFESEPRSNEVLLLIGQLWTEIGDYARSTATIERALQSDPSLVKAHFDEGLAYIRWEHWADAEKQFKAELALSPGDPDATYHLGFVYLQQSNNDDAAALFLQVIAADPDYANAQYQLGKIQLDRGQAADAVTHLEAAARLKPETDYMHYQLQAAYRKLGQSADADRELAIYKALKAKSRERAGDATKQTP